MRRRDLIILLAASAWVQASRGESPRPPVVGLLSNSSPDEQRRGLMPQALRDLGYVEGQNIRFEYRAASGDAERLPALATELVTAGVTVIVSYATPATRAAQKATSTIPIVGVAMADPSRDGLVQATPLPKRTSRETRFSAPNSSPSGWDISRNLFHRSLGSACFGTRKRMAIRP